MAYYCRHVKIRTVKSQENTEVVDVSMEPLWKSMLQDEFDQPYFRDLIRFVKEEYRNHVCFPPGKLIFHAFDYCDWNKLRVVIIGQDPYHGPGQANGLCFSVADGLAFPPSLRNIFKERQNDLGIPAPQGGNLDRWAGQGVLLLNATLTVRQGMPGSHQGKGWETFTDAVIRTISQKKDFCVFVLWGAFAHKKAEIIDETKHHVIRSAHPSPFSADRGFFGSRPFSRTNEFLRSKALPEIDWS